MIAVLFVSQLSTYTIQIQNTEGSRKAAFLLSEIAPFGALY